VESQVGSRTEKAVGTPEKSSVGCSGGMDRGVVSIHHPLTVDLRLRLRLKAS
jgi:hypothetical protein